MVRNIGRSLLLFLGLLLLLPAFAQSNSVLTVQDASSAVRTAGLEFTDAELAQMLASLNRRLATFAAIRAHTIPDIDSPALLFKPRLPDASHPNKPRSFRWSPPRGVQRPAHDEDLAFLPVSDLAALLRSRQVSSEELTRLSLLRLRRYGPALHCVVTLTEERALAAARRADAEIRAGKWRGPLHGIPYGAKDLLATRDTPTTWGASAFTNQVFDSDATVIQRLDHAGAVLVAKLSLGELAMGDVWFGGLTRNPWQPDKGSSGSSAGSCSAVAAGLVPFALGSETLGSIVSPSTVCGVTGLRPTFGRVPRTGAMTLCWSLDKLGPIARSAEDCAIVLQAIQGPDDLDRSTIAYPFACDLNRPLRRLRIGFLEKDLSTDGIHPSNASNHLASLTVLRSLGATLKPVALPTIPKSPLWLIVDAESATAFDAFTRRNLDDTLVQQSEFNWPNSFRSARLIPAVEYLQALRIRSQLMDAMDALFQDLDVLVAPAWNGNILLFSNMTGHPCVTVPNGDKSEGAPASFSFLGRIFGDGDALAAAVAFQRATAWHRQRPDLSRLEAP